MRIGTYFRTTAATALLAAFFSIDASVAGAQTVPVQVTPIQGQTAVSGQQAIDALGANLGTVAAQFGWTADELRQEFLRAADPASSSRMELTGGSLISIREGDIVRRELAAPDTDIVYQPNSETFKLHSNPTASRRIYLNFMGGTLYGTNWSSGTAGLTLSAFSLDGSRQFSDAEVQRIQAIWQRVAEDFSVFDVDVTTAPKPANTVSPVGYFASTVNVFSNPAERCVCNAVRVNLKSFGDINQANRNILVNSSLLGNGGAQEVASAISHALGHALGLRHDLEQRPAPLTGTVLAGNDVWAPIMGNISGASVTQFAQTALTGEDDFAVIGKNGLKLREDDYPNMRLWAKTIPDRSTVQNTGESLDEVDGVLTTQGDSDVFAIHSAPGRLRIITEAVRPSPNANLKVFVADISGKRIATIDPKNQPDAARSVNISVPGTYFIGVTAGGETEAASGNSIYGSRGAYRLVAVYRPSTEQPPVANFTVSSATAEKNTPVRLDASTSRDDKPGLAYMWYYDGRLSQPSSSPVAEAVFSTPGTHTITLNVIDQNGLVSNAVKTVTVTNAPAPAGLATITVRQTAGSKDVSVTAALAERRIADNYVWNWGDGSGQTATTTPAASHSFPAAGTYTVTVTVTDIGGRIHRGTQTVTVAAPAQLPQLTVSSITVTRRPLGQVIPIEMGFASVAVTDANGRPVEGVSVAGEWISDGISRTVLTNAEGRASFQAPASGQCVGFYVSSISKPGHVDPEQWTRLTSNCNLNTPVSVAAGLR